MSRAVNCGDWAVGDVEGNAIGELLRQESNLSMPSVCYRGDNGGDVMVGQALGRSGPGVSAAWSWRVAGFALAVVAGGAASAADPPIVVDDMSVSIARFGTVSAASGDVKG